MQSPMVNGKYVCVCGHEIFSEENGMAKGKGSNGGRSAPRGGKGGVGFKPLRPGGNKPSKTGNLSGRGRGNLPPKNGKQGG